MQITKNVKPSDINVVLGWIKKVNDCFKPYHPETKSMMINYKDKKSEIHLHLRIPLTIRRKIASIVIPAYQNFIISDMMDESFNRVGSLWVFEQGKWKLNSKQLPSSENFLLVMKGNMPSEILEQMVRMQPSRNRDQTAEVDRYWLDSQIRDTEILANMWNELQIDDIDIGVKVGIERSFSSTIPRELQDKLRATRRYLNAGHGRDRNEINRAWADLRRISRSTKISEQEIMSDIYELTNGDVFKDYLLVDRPYSIGNVEREDPRLSIFPEQMNVETHTELTLKNPTASGFLSFKKKEYAIKIKDTFGKAI